MAVRAVSVTHRLVIRVLAEDGRPVPDALITIERGTAPYPEVTRLTGPDGAVAFTLPDGIFQIAARAGAARGRIEVTTATAAAVVDIILAD